jgi:hypothetical protein
MQTQARPVVRAPETGLNDADAHRMQPLRKLQAEISRLKREWAIACQEHNRGKIVSTIPQRGVPASYGILAMRTP